MPFALSVKRGDHPSLGRRRALQPDRNPDDVLGDKRRMTRLLQQRFPKLGHGGRVLLNPVPSAVDGGTRREAPAESSVLLQKTLPLSRNLISFALPIAFLCGFLVLLVSPYGPRLSPDSGGYILMASEAYRNGPLGITIDQWPPGLPW